MYGIAISDGLIKKFSKLARKHPEQLRIIKKKVKEIRRNPHRYKNLRAPLNAYKRVHIDSHFVLVFSIDESSKKVILERFKHHDVVYQK